jgi:hypothetical protein
MGLCNSKRMETDVRAEHNRFILLVTQTSLQAPVTPSERHLERNQKVPGWPGLWGPPWNHLVFLLVSLRGSYGSLKAGLCN